MNKHIYYQNHKLSYNKYSYDRIQKRNYYSSHSNWIDQWIQENFDESIYEKYLEASNIHQQVVQSAIDAGDCVFTEGDGVNDSMRIHWTSEKIHVEYMAKIPKDSHDFYTAMWALYYKAADTNVHINLQE